MGIPRRSVIMSGIDAKNVKPDVISVTRSTQIGVPTGSGASSQFNHSSRHDCFRDGVEAKILVHESFLVRQIPFLIILSKDTVTRMRFPRALTEIRLELFPE